MTPRHIGTIALTLAAALTLGACAANPGARSGPGADDKRYVAGVPGTERYPAAERKQAPDVSGESLEGKPLRLADYRGKVVVLNYWASWCAPCRSESPALRRLSEEFEKDVRFLGVNIKDGRENAKAFQRRFGIEYPSFYDQPGRIALAFQGVVPPEAIPSTLVIDWSGGIAARVIGEVRHSQLKEILESVVAEDG